MGKLLIIITVLIIVLGYLGVFLPILPGLPLILVGIFIYALGTGFAEINLWWLLLLTGLTMLGLAGDYVVGLFTVKRMGASKSGVYGAVLGSIIGLVLGGFPGLIAGQFIGMVVGEIYYGKKIPNSLKSGTGVFLGYVLGTAFKLVIATMITIIFMALVI